LWRTTRGWLDLSNAKYSKYQVFGVLNLLTLLLNFLKL
jgi:hypothetical protein